MLKVSNIKVSLNHSINDVLTKMYRILGTNKINSYTIDKKSIDARKKHNIVYIYAILVDVDNEDIYLKNQNVSKAKIYKLNVKQCCLNKRPVIVGSGPAGLFSALILTMAGVKPIILERGKDVDKRKEDIELFWENAELNIDSNVQFGEGGAGTFSDGKLTTGIKDPRCKIVLNQLVKFGAPEEITYLAKPHIGTDILIDVIRNMRNFLTDNGASFLFEHQLTNFNINNNNLESIIVNNQQTIDVDNVILAIGHSARDTFKLLYEKGVEIAPKPFAMGVRIEHPQAMINNAQYGKHVINSAEYKLACNIDKHGLYTFCMCPGGLVVAASSEEETVVTNGMSYHARNLENANSALLVNITVDEFGGDHPLQGMFLQQELERKAFIFGGSNYYAPAQTVEDFLNNKQTTAFKSVTPTYKPGVTPANLHDFLPKYMCVTIQKGIIEMGKKLQGFDFGEAVLTAIESRSSSPIRIYRDQEFNSNIKGIYPCGEGAGYAGGIMSAAVDGIKCAEALLNIVVVDECSS